MTGRSFNTIVISQILTNICLDKKYWNVYVVYLGRKGSRHLDGPVCRISNNFLLYISRRLTVKTGREGSG